MESTVYNQSGKKVGTIALPESVFNVPLNKNVVHDVIVSMQGNARKPVAHSKDRSVVRGGGRKPWKQKGTGRARHGSRRSPLWRGGGVTFGPTNEKNFIRKINKKVRAKVLYMLLTQKLKSNELLFLDRLDVLDAKTRNAKAMFATMSSIPGFDTMNTKKRNSAFIYTTAKDSNVERGFNNFGNVGVAPLTAMNPLDITKYKYVVITDPEKSIAFLAGKMNSKKKASDKAKTLNPKP